jgi:hypothetical protein
VMINWKRFGRKRSWPNLRHYPGTCPEGLRKTTRNLSQDSRSLGRFHKINAVWNWRSYTQSHKTAVTQQSFVVTVYDLQCKITPFFHKTTVSSFMKLIS